MSQPTQRIITIADIAAAVDQASPVDGARRITGVNTLPDATATELSFIGDDRYSKQLAASKAACVLVGRRVSVAPDFAIPVIRVDNVDIAMAKVLKLFAPPIPRPAVGVDSLARIAPGTQLPADACVGPFVSIGSNVTVGARCVFHPGVAIGDEVIIGDDCEFFANVVIRERITIGHRVVIHANSTIGSDGFGYQWDGKQHLKIPQIGTVIIGDDVELGSGVCIDRAKVGATVIGHGTKIDNLVQIGHNVKTGPHCIMAGLTGIAGSTVLGAGVVIGGASSVRDHITIGDGAIIAARSAVHEDVPAKAIVSGMPALPHRQSLREQAAFRKLPEFMVEARKLQNQVKQYLGDSDAKQDDVVGQ